MKKQDEKTMATGCIGYDRFTSEDFGDMAVFTADRKDGFEMETVSQGLYVFLICVLISRAIEVYGETDEEFMEGLRMLASEFADDFLDAMNSRLSSLVYPDTVPDKFVTEMRELGKAIES